MGGTGPKASTENEKLTGPVSVPVLQTQNSERGDRDGSGEGDDRVGQNPMTALGLGCAKTRFHITNRDQVQNYGITVTALSP
jgi:hypothetical protein